MKDEKLSESYLDWRVNVARRYLHAHQTCILESFEGKEEALAVAKKLTPEEKRRVKISYKVEVWAYELEEP